MKFNKKDLVLINHTRKGKFYAFVERDFDTIEEWYPIILASKEVIGMNTDWIRGESISCRGSLCKIEKVI